MFRAHCQAEGREVLLTARRILSIERRADAVETRFTCWCGHQGTVADPVHPRLLRPQTPGDPAVAA